MKPKIMVKLQVVRAMKYSTRRLVPGDLFEASSSDARLLIATRKAKAVREPADVPPPPPAVAEKIVAAIAPAVSPELAAARADYEAAFGRKPYHGWGVAALRDKLSAGRTP